MRGPIPKYCSESHRQQAYRARQLRRFADSTEFGVDRDLAARNFLKGVNFSAFDAISKATANIGLGSAAASEAITKMTANIGLGSAAASEAIDKLTAGFGAGVNASAFDAITKMTANIGLGSAAASEAIDKLTAGFGAGLNASGFDAITKMTANIGLGSAAASEAIDKLTAGFGAGVNASAFDAITKMTANIGLGSAAASEAIDKLTAGFGAGVNASGFDALSKMTSILDGVLANRVGESPSDGSVSDQSSPIAVDDAQALVATVILLVLYLSLREGLESALALATTALLEQVKVLIYMADQLQDESPILGGVLAMASAASIVSWISAIIRYLTGGSKPEPGHTEWEDCS